MKINNKTQEKLGILLISGIVGGLCVAVLLFINSQFQDSPKKPTAIDSLKITITTLAKQVDSLQLQSEIQWNYIQSVDKIAMKNDVWLSAFKIEYPWIDSRIKEDAVEAK